MQLTFCYYYYYFVIVLFFLFLILCIYTVLCRIRSFVLALCQAVVLFSLHVNKYPMN